MPCLISDRVRTLSARIDRSDSECLQVSCGGGPVSASYTLCGYLCNSLSCSLSLYVWVLLLLAPLKTAKLPLCTSSVFPSLFALYAMTYACCGRLSGSFWELYDALGAMGPWKSEASAASPMACATEVTIVVPGVVSKACRF